jgi:hypothetical protein
LDSSGNLFIADYGNARIRKVDTKGIITTFRANTYDTKLVFDNAGNLYATEGAQVARYYPTGTRVILAGQSRGFSGDGGPAVQALVQGGGQASGISIDAEGNIFFVDGVNRRVRVIRFGAVIAPPNALVQASSSLQQSATAGSALAAPLVVSVRDQNSNPANGVRVDFSAPSSGASCVFPNGSNTLSAFTDTSGKVTVRAYANCEAGTYEITATLLASSTTLRFNITNTTNPAGNPLPELRSNSPSTAFAGAASFSLKVMGSKFVPCSSVLWNGSPVPTIFLSDTLLLATISASKVDTLGTMQVSVFNPAPGGGTSQPIAFQILLSPPTLVSPSDTATGVSTSPTLKWTPSPRATLYHLQVSKDSAFTKPLVDDSTITATSKQIDPLEQGTMFFWRVCARASGAAGTYSSVQRFKTAGVSSVERVGDDLPKEYSLAQNFPNPFNPMTVIEFSLPKTGYVSLVVFNSLGQEVQTLMRQQMAPGRFRVQWNAANVASGVYLCQLRAGEFMQTKKLVLIR